MFDKEAYAEKCIKDYEIKKAKQNKEHYGYLDKITKRIKKNYLLYKIGWRLSRRFGALKKCKYCENIQTTALCSRCYTRVHDWIKKRKKKPTECIDCGSNKIIELANISQEYKYDINDYEYLCHKCHNKKYKKGGVFGT